MNGNRNIERLSAFGALAAFAGAGSGAVWGDVPLGATLALALLGVGWLGIRLRLAGALPSLRELGGGRGVRVAGVLLGAGLLVGASMTGAMGGAAVGTASAQSYEECNDDAIVSGFLMGLFGPTAGGQAAECIETQDELASENNQTALDIYSAASTNAQTWESTRRVRLNYLEDLQTVAYSKGQAAAYAAWENKTDVNGDGVFNETDFVLAGPQSSQNYISQKERNFVERWETQGQTAVSLALRAQNESGVSDRLVLPESGYLNNQYDWHIENTSKANYTLVNGTSVSYDAIHIAGFNDRWAIGVDALYDVDNNKRGNDSYSSGVQINASSVSNQSSFEYLNTSKNLEVTDKFNYISEQSAENVRKWANGTYDALENGTLNATEALNPSTIAQEYAPNYDAQNGSGYYAYAAASLSAAGLSTPDLNQTASMSIRYAFNRTVQMGNETVTRTNETVLTGLLMSQNAPPSGSWELNTTYNASALTGQQLMASQNWGIRELEGEFDVVSIQNKDGETLTNTSTQQYAYQAVNNSEYLSLQENLTDLRMAMEDYEAARGGGGGSGLGDLPPWAVGGGLAAAVFALAYAMRQNNGGGRRAS